MTNHVPLNNIDHKDLRISLKRSAEKGDNVMSCLTYPFEFRNVQAHYPIFFHKDAGTGQFSALAMFGFERGENLFLGEDGWDADYIPMVVDREPFLVGRSDGLPMVHIDMDSPRITTDEEDSVSVFLEHGGNSEYLEHITGLLDALHQGHQASAEYMQTLQDMDLLESFTIDIELNDGSENRLAGFYIINEESLYALGGDDLATLNEKAYLQPIYMAVASLSRIKPLIDRKNARL